MLLLTNLHKLKEKKKNISRELGKLYTKKRTIVKQIDVLEEAKLNNKISIQNQKEKQKKKRIKKKTK